MKCIGDGSPENAEGLRMQCIQSTGGHVNRYLAGQEQILIENKLQLLILLAAPFDHAGTCVDFDPAAGLQIQLGFYGAAATLDLGDLLVRQRS